MDTPQQLSELRRAHPVLFLLVHDGEEDRDWHSTFTKVAMEKALRGRFCYTTEPGIVEVRLGRDGLVPGIPNQRLTWVRG